MTRPAVSMLAGALLLLMSFLWLPAAASQRVNQARCSHLQKGAAAALSDPDLKVKEYALRFLLELPCTNSAGRDEVAKRTVSVLQADSVTVKNLALTLLGTFRNLDEAAIATVARLTAHPNPKLRASALNTLKSQGKRAATYNNEIAPLLHDANRTVQKAALHAAIEIDPGNRQTHEVILQHLASRDQELRNLAIGAASKLIALPASSADNVVRLLDTTESADHAAVFLLKMPLSSMPRGRAGCSTLMKRLTDTSTSSPIKNALACRFAERDGVTSNSIDDMLRRKLANANFDFERGLLTHTSAMLGQGRTPFAPETGPQAARDYFKSSAAFVDPYGYQGLAPAFEFLGDMLGSMLKSTQLFFDRTSSENFLTARIRREWAPCIKYMTADAGRQGYWTRQLELHFRSPKPAVRAAAMFLYGKVSLHTPKAVLLKGIDDKDLIVKAMSLHAVGMHINKQPALSSLAASQLHHQPPLIRKTAVEVLRKGGAIVRLHVQALEKLLLHKNKTIRATAIQALGQLTGLPSSTAHSIIELLKDRQFVVRVSAARALKRSQSLDRRNIAGLKRLLSHKVLDVRRNAANSFGRHIVAADPSICRNLLELLNDRFPLVQIAALSALQNCSPNQSNVVSKRLAKYVYAIDTVPDPGSLGRIQAVVYASPLPAASSLVHASLAARKRSLAVRGPSKLLFYLLCGNSDDCHAIRNGLLWTKTSEARTARHEEAVAFLRYLQSNWAELNMYPELKAEFCQGAVGVMAEHFDGIAEIDKSLLEWFRSSFERDDTAGSAALSSVFVKHATQSYLKKALHVLWAHPLFWLLLVLVYPRSTVVQSMLFWNRAVRKVVGLLYVDFLIAYVPLFRNRLLLPCKNALAGSSSYRDLHSDYEVGPYFEGLRGRTESEDNISLHSLIHKKQRGHLALIGPSGSGKTAFLVHLVDNCDSPIAYLQGSECAEGVIEAISSRLPGFMSDHVLLEQLVYCGAITLCIDGIDEISAYDRNTIANFIARNPKSNVIIASQPTDWKIPRSVRAIEIQALNAEEVEEFLVTRKFSGAGASKDYMEACRAFSTRFLGPEFDNCTTRLLSNPMDLETIGRLLLENITPSLHTLYQQYCSLSERHYSESKGGQPFPRVGVSETAYQMRINRKAVLPQNEVVQDTISSMRKYKLVVSAGGAEATEYRFRHEKIMDYFILPALCGDNEARIAEHICDTRFLGVFKLMAESMPIGKASELMSDMLNEGARRRTHEVSDSFAAIIRSRIEREERDS